MKRKGWWATHGLHSGQLGGEDDLCEGLGGCDGLFGLGGGLLELVLLGEVEVPPVCEYTPLWGVVVVVNFLHVLDGTLAGGGGGGVGAGVGRSEGGGLGEEGELLIVIIFVSSLRSAEGGKGRDEGAETSGLGLGCGLGGRLGGRRGGRDVDHVVFRAVLVVLAALGLASLHCGVEVVLKLKLKVEVDWSWSWSWSWSRSRS